ncbi:phosphoribosyl-ATP diphosphatase [Candidatus Vallotia tarda]|uniref:Phosphoribosyl-ATP pyrophosphatase n=1 Tax=Candidatus Vallotiella hemipterorum TaxID=1177213 RepID=A0A916JU72_9BURK|nr:phosphoribosyl-ATP diphosphatase [Candidatus Vallotia tarda]CAG7603253.1 Phosphoribosyl-ATP pyrophosphatase [Candidatus Vallotia tarda]
MTYDTKPILDKATNASSPLDVRYTQDNIFMRLTKIIDSHKGGDPKSSYVAQLFHKGADEILKKVGEEAIEVVMAAKDAHLPHSRENLIKEVADLWFHSLIMLSYYGVKPNNVLAELQRREGLSGIEEKALRKSVRATE